jgi:hypothetical protein
MAQALYDYQHGMSPEELWARYRQYPMEDKLYSEPEHIKGPVMPDNIKLQEFIPYLRGYYTPGSHVTVNSLLDRGLQLRTLNHETTHDRQYKDGGDMHVNTPYIDNPAEAQARIVSNMSYFPDKIKDMVNPLSLAHMAEYGSVQGIDLAKTARYFGNRTDLPIEKKVNIIEQIIKLASIPQEQSNDAIEFNNSRKKWAPKQSLIDLLQSGRNFYYPPLISGDK